MSAQPHRAPSPALARWIRDYMFIEPPVGPANIGFVFGTPHHTDAHADRAADLWHRGLVPRFIVSGGVRTDQGGIEATEIAAKMMARGVPREAILLETAATNTGENVRNSLPILERETPGGLAAIGSVLAVGKIYAARRYLMTLNAHLPGRQLSIAPVNNFSVPPARWTEDPAFLRLGVAEWNKVWRYKQKGFIREIDLSGLPTVPPPGRDDGLPAPADHPEGHRAEGHRAEGHRDPCPHQPRPGGVSGATGGRAGPARSGSRPR